MKVLETRATVATDGKLRIVTQAPPEIAPGEHRAVLVIDEGSAKGVPREPLRLIPLDLQGWPAESTFRREDIYRDDGR